MIPRTIQKSEASLRRAVEQRQFPRVENLILSYCELVDAHLLLLAAGDAERLELLTRVIGVLKWTRLMMTTARAENSDRLDQLLMAKRYFGAAGTSRAGVAVEF